MCELIIILLLKGYDRINDRSDIRTIDLNVIKLSVCSLSDGYPDPDYLKTVRTLLKDKGIK